jgi:hypothetical protein
MTRSDSMAANRAVRDEAERVADDFESSPSA